MSKELIKGKWVKWYGFKNGNDGRRDSAIGYNESKYHLITQDGSFIVACGRAVIHTLDVTDNPLVENVCKQCLARSEANHYPFRLK